MTSFFFCKFVGQQHAVSMKNDLLHLQFPQISEILRSHFFQNTYLYIKYLYDGNLTDQAQQLQRLVKKQLAHQNCNSFH